jgi:hypothetical protein
MHIPVKSILVRVVLVVSLFYTLSACGDRPPLRADAASHERGRYLVERVGMCQDCHSPRDQQGQFLLDRWLQGSPLPFQPTVPMPWAGVSKPIAGLPGLSAEQAEHFLCTGELPGGRRALPPMPDYRFAPEDARDIVAYLKHGMQPGDGR